MEPNELAEVYGLLRGMASARPELTEAADSLVSEAIEGLVRWVARQDRPPSTEDLRRVGATILKRRIVDHYRNHLEFTQHDLEAIADDAPSSSDRLGSRQVLAVVFEFIGDLPTVDRDLVDQVMSGDAGLDVRERKRLSRIRTRLRAFVSGRLGADIEELL